ncbi:MAG: hypothetical protein WCX83_00230 [Candidatus Cloacimonas sp.]
MNNILMNIEMTKAILDGRKVQTRRVFKDDEVIDTFLKNGGELNKIWVIDKYSKYQIGETIWVREPAKVISSIYDGTVRAEYIADGETTYFNVGRFEKDGVLPKWITNCQGIPNGCIKEMARIFLKITNVRVEILQDITFEDIFKEGFDGKVSDYFISTRYKEKAITADTLKELEILNWWISVWDKTAKTPYKWANNPYTFVNDFERVEK